MEQIYMMQPFKCAGMSPTEARAKWMQFKRAFDNVVIVTGESNKTKLKSLLLTYGGLELQDVFYNIPGADVQETSEVDPYKMAVDKLEAYFAPKRHDSFERYMFWSLKPDPDEPFEKFVLRIQQYAGKCAFGTSATEARAQAVMDKVIMLAPKELREKILSKEDMSVDDLMKMVNSYQAVKCQAKEMNGEHVSGPSGGNGSTQESVNQIRSKFQKPMKEIKGVCYRCGKSGHFGRDPECPARDKKCAKCQKIGHFAAICRSRGPQKRRSEDPIVVFPKKAKINVVQDVAQEVTQEKETEPKTCFLYNIGEGDEFIWCQVGGVLVEMLIDSGASQNIIAETTWKYLNMKGIKFANVSEGCRKELRAYAQAEPLQIIKVFKADVCVGRNEMCSVKDATFYVVRGGTQSLLSKNTAKALGVLTLGLPSTKEMMIGQVDSNRKAALLKMKGIKLKIPIDETITPIQQHPRRPPIALLKMVEEKLDDLLRDEVIEPVEGHSDWISPIVVAVKDDGRLNLWVDMRQVNKAVIMETHLMPTPENLFSKFGAAKVFSRLKMKDAYHQVELEESCRYITTFITHKGVFRYKTLMSGIKGAREMLHRILQGVLMSCKNTVSYIDAIIVFGATHEEHEVELKKVLSRLAEFGVLLDHSKCSLGVDELEFLGHKISGKGVRPILSKTEAIQNFRAPATKEETRSFLELVSYIGSSIPDVITLAGPLQMMMSTKKSFKWESIHQKAFEMLKDKMSDERTLSLFHKERRTRVVADASPVALGAVLVQFEDETDEKVHIIAYATKSLSDMERGYCQTEKEALALVWSVEKFFVYLLAREFELVTDHKPLETIFKPTTRTCTRIERWLLRLQSFTFKVIYQKGKTNIADPLSRLSVSRVDEEFDVDGGSMIRAILESAAIDVGEIEAAARDDLEIQAIHLALKTDNWAKDVLKPYQVFRLEFGAVGDIVVRGTKFVVPQTLRQRMLELAHEGHPGETMMKKRLRERVWWPAIDADVVKFVKACEGCRLVSLPDRPEPMHRRELPTGPWKDIAIDFMGPLPSGEYVLVVVDYFSRYKQLAFMRRITAADTIDILDSMFSNLGYPTTMTLDNAKQFVGGELGEYCAKKGIILNNTTPYWPAENGEVERQNRSVLKRIRISHNLKRNWKKDLNDYLMMYNTTPHSTTGRTPSDLYFGRTIRSKIPSLRDVGEAPPPEEFRDRDRILKEKGKEREDKRRHATKSNIGVGDTVIMKNLLPGNKLQSTFSSKRYLVKEKTGSSVVVEDQISGKTYRRKVTHLKKCPAVVAEEEATDDVGTADEEEAAEVFQPRRSLRIQAKR